MQTNISSKWERIWDSLATDCSIWFSTSRSVFSTITRWAGLLSKRVHLKPFIEKDNANNTGSSIFAEFLANHEINASIVFNRNLKFTASFFNRLMKLCGLN